MTLPKIAPIHIAIAAAIVVVLGGIVFYAVHRSESPQVNIAAGANPDTAKKIDALTAEVEQGTITQQQYDTQVAALVNGAAAANPAGTAGTASASAPAANKAQQFDALNSALDSGLITKDEYDAKMAALTGGAASPPQGPAQSAPASPQGNYQSTDNPGGGHIITGSLGQQPSPQAAMGELLRRIHSEFGDRPNVTQVANDPTDNSVALFFTANRNGQPFMGMALANAAPGAQASGVVLYDSTQQFGSTFRPMLQQLQAMTNPQAGGGGAPAPAEPLVHHEFGDGTGSIDIPADWRLMNGGGGSAAATGPGGEIVSYNMVVGAMDPNNQVGQNYLRNLPPQYRQLELQRTALVPYTGNPVQAWTTVVDQLSRQKGGHGPSINVQNWQNMSGSGINLAEVTGQASALGGTSGNQIGTYLAYVQVTPPNGMGQWSMYATWIFVPNSEFMQMGNTAAAVLESVRINFGAVAAQSAAIRNMFQQKFDNMMQNARQFDVNQREKTDEFLANDAIRQDEMHKQAVGWENFALDRTAVVNTATGEHGLVDNQFANALLRDDFELPRDSAE